MNNGIRRIYSLLLKEQSTQRVMKIDHLPGNWLLIVFEDCSGHAIPPILSEGEYPRYITLHEEL